MKCAGCRRQLRTEESRRRGLGPTCWARLAPEQRAAIEQPAGRPVRVAASPAQIPTVRGQIPLPIPEPLPLDDPVRTDLPRDVRRRPIETVPVGSEL